MEIKITRDIIYGSPCSEHIVSSFVDHVFITEAEEFCKGNISVLMGKRYLLSSVHGINAARFNL